ncbi:MAG: two component transcriptional regulator [Betaproteobacteria bacterium]|nr:two component transcriptional regulator [Betaproteobacteria bacterium]
MTDLTLRSRCVLCVEDDPEARAVLSEVFAGHTRTFARNAYEGICALNSGIYDMYVLDYWLPDWSGVQLCREIRKVDPHGPVIFCTAAVRDEDRKRAMRAGANAYLGKPIDRVALHAQMVAWLELADVESIHAKVEEERAIHDELSRRACEALARADAARDSATLALERSARTKAYKAFIARGGTRANFDRWWPQVFGSARASTGLPAPASRSRYLA